MRKIVLFDLSYMMYRNYYASKNEQVLSWNGVETGLLYRFFRSFFSVLKKEKDSMYVLCRDMKPYKRFSYYSNYKGHRSSSDESFKIQAHQLCDYFEMFSTALVGQIGYEADDIIAAYIKKYADDNTEFVIISSDSDLYQLLNSSVRMMSKNKMITSSNLKELYGVDPQHVVTYKSIVGDGSDDIVGIKGVGKKSAIAYIEGNAKPKVIEAIEHHKEMIERNKRLIQLPYDDEIDVSLPTYSFSTDSLQILIDRCGFQSFVGKEELYLDILNCTKSS